MDKLHSAVHPQWKGFLTHENLSLLHDVETQTVSTNFTPPVNRVLHFMTIDPTNAKVVIIGQDPYPQEGVATGRCFEVGTLTDWNQPFRNVSLRNILRLIYRTYYGQTLSFKEVVAWNNSAKAIEQPDQLFKNWEKQGALMLNTAFTCEIGVSASHSKIWKPLSNNLLQYLNHINPKLHWVGWGNHARGILANYELKNVHLSHHPMMCSSKSTSDFLFGSYNTLEATRHVIDWRGKA